MQYSIVNLQQVRNATKNFRFDAEYFEPIYLDTENLIKSKDFLELRKLISVLTDYHANGSYELLRNNVRLLNKPDYAYMIRTVDLERDDFENDVIYVDKHAYDFLNKTKIFGGEVIINKIGNAGKVYIVPPLKRKTTLGMNQFMIRTNEKVNNYYLYCYLSCKYGQNQLKQRITGAVPLSIDKESIRSVLVPLFSKNLQNLISSLMNKYFLIKEKSREQYHEAQNLLLSELGLLDWKPKHQLSFVKNFSDTQKAGRIDAEYFQPKYDEIVKAIKNYSGGWDILGKLVSVKKCVEVGRNEYINEGIPFIRVSNLSPFEITEEKYISEELYLKLSEHQPQKGEILLSKDATPGIAYYINEEPRKMIPSGGILRLRRRDNRINDESLTTILNSLIVQEQINRDVGGSVILHWRPDQVKNTLIPILTEPIQREIKQKINESFNLRKQSKHLLESAKRAVEIAIEEDEDTAINWLNEQVENL